ncbi:MAG: molybdopterin-dependent oxidoreductase [Desulfobacterales bacterium]|nr:molybdopterin-dependent oxidoreductase [Desulfobacterales bacterium]
MKMDRRAFLSLGVGVAAGTTLSPLPWKLMDDISIWTQNWSWTPVPDDGECTYINSVCRLCSGACGITVRKIGNRVVKIEGQNGHPINDGGICLLGLSSPQILYGQERVQRPLKRDGKRGEGKWIPISWENAIQEVFSKLQQLRSQDMPNRLACITGTDQGTVPRLFERFLTVFGSPNYIRMPSIVDSYELTLNLMQGGPSSVGFDFESADYILSFGSGIIDGWTSPVRMFKLNSQWKDKNIKCVQIESRLSNSAAKASQWIPIQPGTEAELAMGIAHVMVKENWYHPDFVQNQSNGFAEWRTKLMANVNLEHIATITGVHQDVIIQVAKEFANASTPIAICGQGRGLIPGNMREFVAVHTLNALKGNINQKGGVGALAELDYIDWPEVMMDAIATKGMAIERIDHANTDHYPYARYLMSRLPKVLLNQKEPMLEMLFVLRSNPYYSLPGTAIIKEAWEKIPFIVSFSSVMDETALYSDLILPEPFYLETYEDIPTPTGYLYPMIGLMRPVIQPLYDTKPAADVLIQLAQKFEGTVAKAFSWSNYQTCLEKTLKDKWDTMIKKGYFLDTSLSQVWKKEFTTLSGKFEFKNMELKELEKETTPELEGSKEQYPLLLIPYDSLRIASTSVANPPFVTKTIEDNVLKQNDVLLEINPITAKSLGVKEHDLVEITTPHGRAIVRIHLFEGIMPGLIAMARGLGHETGGDYLYGKGVNVNSLLGSIESPFSGFEMAYATRANLRHV